MIILSRVTLLMLAAAIGSPFLFASNTPQVPELGAAVYLESWQPEAHIDRLFKIMADHGLTVARIAIADDILPQTDMAFTAAEKHGIRIEATLRVPEHPPDEKTLAHHEVSIRATVRRYRDRAALDHWWLMNEPSGGISNDPLTTGHWQEWLLHRYGTIDSLNAAWGTRHTTFADIPLETVSKSGQGWQNPTSALDLQRFARDNLTWMLRWIGEQVRKEDAQHPLHTNPHAIFSLLPRYDIPAWRSFLLSMGASIHPSWHFAILKRDQFAMGMAVTCDIIRGGIEPHPFWVSELQGGNNTWSGNVPIGPEAEDIAQWAWTGIGCGAKKIVFWLLNNRRQGAEAGEWSMLDFQGDPSERLLAASQVARSLVRERDFFGRAVPIERRVTILLSPESMLILARKARTDSLAGRSALAHLQSALGYYKTLSELGIPVAFKFTDDFDWENRRGHLAILPHAVAVPQPIVRRAETYVANGNTLLIDGLTGCFDENEVNVLQTRFFFEELCGATVKDIRTIEESFVVQLGPVSQPLPAHLWQTEILNRTATVLGRKGGRITGVKNRFGAGTVLWVPSLLGLGAWLHSNDGLAEWLLAESAPFTAQLPFRFEAKAEDTVLQILQAGDTYATVLTNGKSTPSSVHLRVPARYRPEVLFATAPGRHAADAGAVQLGPRETLVTIWRPDGTAVPDPSVSGATGALSVTDGK